MSSHRTQLENRHAQALRVGEMGGCTGQSTTVPSAESLPIFSASPETHHRLPTGLRGGIFQAPSPNQASEPTPWIAVAFPSILSGTADLVWLGLIKVFYHKLRVMTTCVRYNLRRVTRGFYMLPKSLYELLPFLYIALGVVSALVLYNSYAIISGILLLTVALMILYMRLKSRTKAMERFERLYAQKKRQD